MRKEARRGECKKCGNVFYVHAHHIKSKAIFGKGEKVDLCPNCHTHFHEYSNLNTINSEDENEAVEIWFEWLKKVIIACFIVGILVFVNEFIN